MEEVKLGNGVDPTRNVLDIFEAERRRADDLREMEGKWRDKLDTIRAKHYLEMGRKESERIDAIRAVDVGNVQRAAEVQANQATILASSVVQSAEALRAQVASTAMASDAKLVTVVEPIQKRIDDLTRAQYEQQGSKAQVTEARDAASEMAPVLAAIKRLEESQSEQAGAKTQVTETQAKSGISGMWIAIAIAGMGAINAFVVGVAGIAMYLLSK